MDLIDRLRPRWRHADPEVRAAAVRELGPEDQHRLAPIAETDPDVRVRRAALKRLDDDVVLARLAASDPEAALRELAAERAREVRVALARSDRSLEECQAALGRLTDERDLVAVATAAEHAAIRSAALARVDGDRALRDVARGGRDTVTRRAAIERIEDPAMLRAIAVSDAPPDVALHALERIGDAEVLRAVAEHRAASKAVRQRARALVASDPSAPVPVAFKEGRARQHALSIEADGLVGSADALAAAEHARELMRAWDALARDVTPRADVADRFRSACDAVLDDAARLERRLAEADHSRHTLEEGLAVRQSLCERVEGLDGAEARRELGRARGEWSRLTPVPDPRADVLATRFAAACDACAQRVAAWRAQASARSEVETLVIEAEGLAAEAQPPAAKRWRAVERRWSSLDRPADADPDGSLDARFAQARARLEERWREAQARREDEQRENLARLEDLSRRVQATAAAETIRPAAARRDLRAIEAAVAEPGALPPAERRAAWVERLSEARDALLRRVRAEEETEEWRRWANVGAQEELILRVEALLEANDLAEGTRQLGRLQDEWAKIATASPDKSQALWERFRTARNELRRRCDAYLTENLAKKRALVARVAAVGESSTWNETSDLVRRLQAEWKTIGPVPGKHAQALWQAFREPCDRFFARRNEQFARQDAQRQEIATQKIALCEQAEALADSTDWDATTVVMKRLQADWKRGGGGLPRGQADALWHRFRTACDRFFDRRGRREEIAREDALAKAAAVCEGMEALATAVAGETPPEPEALGPQIDAAWAEWVHLDLDAGERTRALAERLGVAIAAVAAARPGCLRGTRLDPETTRKRREKLCVRMEELAAAATAVPRALSLQEMAMALRDRLATNTIAGGGGARGPDAAREAERIEATWANLGPPVDAEGVALAARFAEARRRIGG